MSTRRRIVAALIGSLLLTSVLPAAASSFEEESGRTLGPRVPKLVGTTTFKSMGGFNSIDVVLTRPASISLDTFFNEDIKVSSKAGISGVSIRQADGDIEIITISAQTCVELPCSGKPLQFTTTSTIDNSRTLKLPAGEYIVTLFSDKDAVSATVKLKGLGGKATLQTFTPSEGKAGDLEPYINDNSVRPLYSADSEQSLTGVGMVLIGLVVETPRGPQEGEIDACLTSRDAPVDVPAPHQLVCLGGSGSFMSWNNDDGRYALMLDYYLTDAGDYTHSINYRGVTESKGARGFELVLDYERGQRDHFTGGTVFGSGN